MSETSLLLKAYYETLYEMLEDAGDALTGCVRRLLAEELRERDFEDFEQSAYEAYEEACMAFVTERIETYNPIGYQYMYDRARASEAFELELELNWYDARAEYVELVEAAACKAGEGVTDDNLKRLVEELIFENGAFPDKSIISAYESAPALQKLPDYIVARAIEETIRGRGAQG
ncbi:MAG: hypothetical protein JW720_06875 [Sedimentisphaerales bacterium]|nr:hypothetical protein [Sedimentisphaerales bacterium]